VHNHGYKFEYFWGLPPFWVVFRSKRKMYSLWLFVLQRPKPVSTSFMTLSLVWFVRVELFYQFASLPDLPPSTIWEECSKLDYTKWIPGQSWFYNNQCISATSLFKRGPFPDFQAPWRRITNRQRLLTFYKCSHKIYFILILGNYCFLFFSFWHFVD